MKFHEDGTLPTGQEIFVFGSNLAGVHGAGAAKVALDHFGAIMWNGFGIMGTSYAIPTKDENIQTMSLDRIKPFVNVFVNFTKHNYYRDFSFFVTSIGCGLAGYQPSDIAPMFIGAQNCNFPDTWREYL